MRVQVITRNGRYFYLIDRVCRTKPRRDKRVRSANEAPSHTVQVINTQVLTGECSN